MPRTQEGLARLIDRQGLRDPRIADAFRRVDRASFVPPDERTIPYRDRPVPLPEGQTTSQPSLIARMIDAAAPEEGSSVLEVGTGYGFQTALLSVLAGEVVSVERSPGLAAAARANLERNGIRGPRVYVGDGWEGWRADAPYDAVVVSAAAAAVPGALVEQLREGGRLVIPVRSSRSDDVLLYVKKEGTIGLPRIITLARFVPLVRKEQR